MKLVGRTLSRKLCVPPSPEEITAPGDELFDLLSLIWPNGPDSRIVFVIVSEGEDNPDLLGHFMGWPA